MISEFDQEMAGRRKKRKRFLIVAGFVVLVFILMPIVYIAVLSVRYYHGIKSGAIHSREDVLSMTKLPNVSANPNVSREDLDRLQSLAENAPELGKREAKITIVEFVDYQCPFCKDSAAPIRKVIESEGDRVHLIIRHFPIAELHAEARDAALAAMCALEQGQKAYWRYQELLFAEQENLGAEAFRTMAGNANINVARFDECMAARRFDLSIDRDIETGKKVNVEGTPTFFINGMKYEGSLDERMIRAMIEQVDAGLPK